MTKDLDMDLLNDVFRAYFDARKNKRNTINQLQFEMNFEENLVELASEIQNRTYKVGRSVCFIVFKPVQREIFAADFRDRVVHHLIYNYINKTFERQFVSDCYSCRKGFGTSQGIERIEHHARSVTDNYTKTAYVLKLDLQGYFMSIKRQTLYDKMEKVLTSKKNRKDKRVELELYLLREIIFNDPTDNCLVKGLKRDWDGLPRSKSLFYSPKGCGLPIGNLTSQLFSNVYLCDFDNYIKRELKIKHYGRYVDDFFLMHESKEYLLDVMNKIKVYLKENESLTIHPKKIYLQEVSKGVTFLGAHIKPHRRYIRNKVLGNIRNTVRTADYHISKARYTLNTEQMSTARSRMNSYLGYMTQFKAQGYRKEIWDACHGHKKYFTVSANWKKVKLKEQNVEPVYDAPIDIFAET